MFGAANALQEANQEQTAIRNSTVFSGTLVDQIRLLVVEYAAQQTVGGHLPTYKVSFTVPRTFNSSLSSKRRSK